MAGNLELSDLINSFFKNKHISVFIFVREYQLMSYSLAENLEISEKYDVFISFSGADVRFRFLSHLLVALGRKQIHVLVDDDLERGEHIAGSLFEIIEGVHLSIVIFSQNYPKSKWCLEELEKIHESMKQRNQMVIPVFYDVNPSDVQHLKGSYAVELQKWRDALLEISYLSGFDSNNSLNEAKLIGDIVDNVSTKLSKICPSISKYKGLIGMGSSIKEVESLLCLDSTNDVTMVGIWGMAGIGKTTIASKVFDKIKKKFGGHCFVSNVRETLSARNGLAHVRDKILGQLLGDKNIKMDSPLSIDGFMHRRLKRVQVLLVLDDVHTCTQLKSLLETIGLYSPDSFCPGSRVIITSRDSQVLKYVKWESYVYEAKELKDIEALHLLRWHAFGQYNPQGYENLLEKAVQYAHGLPLALVVLGSELKQKPRSHWEDALKKFNAVSPFEIQQILRTSFDGLDRDEKHIFLDVACLLKGNRRDHVENVLEAYGFHARVGLDRLIDKSLLKEEKEEKGVIITMHDLLQQMGKEIVIEEKQSQQQQSRLWTFDDTKDALTNNRGIENVEAISIQYYNGVDEINITSEAFFPLCKLRFLSLNSYPTSVLNVPTGLEFLPDSIRYFEWSGFPLNYLPSNYNPEKLFELSLKFSKLKEVVWSKPLVSLKRVVLCWSENLTKISDLGMAPNLEVANLSFCSSLIEIGTSLENLKKLRKLNVKGCRSLSHLPELPCSLVKLGLAYSGLQQLPTTIGRLTHLKDLSLRFCKWLKALPSSLSSLASLKRLDLRDCWNLNELPEDLGNLESLKELDASSSGLSELPLSIKNLNKLVVLKLRDCRHLQSLTALPPNLEVLDMGECESLEILPSPFVFPKTSVDLCMCLKLKQLEPSIILQYLSLAKNRPIKTVPSLCIPGSEVPKWMEYRNKWGNIVFMELKSQGHPVHLIFCVVLDPAYFDLSNIKAIITHEYGEEEHCYDINDSIEWFGSYHVFLWNGLVHHTRLTAVSFECNGTWMLESAFTTETSIVGCGVHPIYLSYDASFSVNKKKRSHFRRLKYVTLQ